MAVVVTKADEQDEIDYDKLCNVFYDKHTSNLHQRQLANAIFRPVGSWVSDLLEETTAKG